MSKQKWAALVYGRSYHLDFRFITIPQDFTTREIAWVSPYILATTQKARNLANSPRWSLFKNNSHCVVGVTCMVRDLIGKLGEDFIDVMAKDELGRPLYVFVGYVTKLGRSKSLKNLPAYTEVDLNSFKPLYQEIEKVWLSKDYDDRKPLLSEYKFFDNAVEIANLSPRATQISQLNNCEKHPEQVFIWHSSSVKDRQAWRETAQCLESTSICLNIKKKCLLNSPFLNQTVTNIEEFAVQKRIFTEDKDSSDLSDSKYKIDNILPKQPLEKSNTFSLKEKISTRAKEDFDLTMEHAAKLTSSSQELIDNLTPWSNSDKQTAEQSNLSKDYIDEFGYKNKKNPLPSRKLDWF